MPLNCAFLLLSGWLLITAGPAMLSAQSMSNEVTAATESLLIARGDLLEVKVLDVPELERRIRVSDAGDIWLPLVREVHVAGLTAALASQRIGEALQRGEFVRKPEVTIVVLEYATEDVSISGEVMHPGNYPLRTPRPLMNVLSLAGGVTTSAGVHISVKRRGREDSVDAVLSNDPAKVAPASVMVEPGDLVTVPRAGIVYVLGDVGRPGGYVMQNDATMSALQAVALASGTTKTSAESHARLLRQTADGPIEQTIDLRAMQKGKLRTSNYVRRMCCTCPTALPVM